MVKILIFKIANHQVWMADYTSSPVSTSSTSSTLKVTANFAKLFTVVVGDPVAILALAEVSTRSSWL